MAKTKMNGRTFRFGDVEQAADIPAEIWERALPKLQSVFNMRLSRRGQVAIKGGAILEPGATMDKSEWHRDFCAVFTDLSGTRLSATPAC